MGHHTTPGHDANLHLFLRQACSRPDRRCPLPDLLLHRPRVLGLLLQRCDERRKQPDRKYEPDPESLLPKAADSGSRGWSRVAGLCYSVGSTHRTPDLLWVRGDLELSNASAARRAWYLVGARCGNLAIGAERQVSRRAI